MTVCGITRPLGRLSHTSRQVAHVLRTRSPVALAGPRDLHVLSTPPAFVLSQDQTLQECLKKALSDPLSITLTCIIAKDSASESQKMFGQNSPRQLQTSRRINEFASHIQRFPNSIINQRHSTSLNNLVSLWATASKHTQSIQRRQAPVTLFLSSSVSAKQTPTAPTPTPPSRFPTEHPEFRGGS